MKLNIKYKSKLTRIKDIEKRNKAFDALSDEDKRKEIAWDSLQMILLGKMDASWGYYWDEKLRDIKDSEPKSFQKKLLEVESCSVCARGAVMLSQIRLGNKLHPKILDIDKGNDGILNGFNMFEMEQMEKEFEQSYFDHPYCYNTREKLANILCNVIVNGHFNTDDRNDYLKH